MCIFERRLQILLDQGRYRRVTGEAKRRKTSVAEVIREAIDLALPDDPERKQAAGRAILDAKPIAVPATVEELKAEIAAAHTRGL